MILVNLQDLRGNLIQDRLHSLAGAYVKNIALIAREYFLLLFRSSIVQQKAIQVRNSRQSQPHFFDYALFELKWHLVEEIHPIFVIFFVILEKFCSVSIFVACL